MSTIEQMLTTHPSSSSVEAGALRACIEACYECAQACTACADACLAEDDVAQLVRCIRLNLDCADVCDITGRMLSRQTHADVEMLRTQLQACVQACRTCGDECEQHAQHMPHCRVCAEACRRCEQACQQVLADLGA